MPGVQRWQFYDPKTNVSWTVPLNPNAMTSPYPQRKYIYNSTTAGPAGTTVVNEAHRDPVQWQFSGEILDQAHFDALVLWSRKQNRIQIVDHYGRVFLVNLDQFSPIPKRAYGKPWRHTYTMTASIYTMLDATTPPPTVTGVAPGGVGAGIQVTITGLNFTGATAVHFGPNAATYTVVDDGTIIATAPADPGEDVVITVTTLKGTSSPSSAAAYRYTFHI